MPLTRRRRGALPPPYAPAAYRPSAPPLETNYPDLYGGYSAPAYQAPPQVNYPDLYGGLGSNGKPLKVHMGETEPNYRGQKGEVSQGGWFNWVPVGKGYWARNKKQRAVKPGARPQYQAYKKGREPATDFGSACEHGYPCGEVCMRADSIANCQYSNADPWRAEAAMVGRSLPPRKKKGTGSRKRKAASSSSYPYTPSDWAYKKGYPPTDGPECDLGIPCGRTCLPVKKARNCTYPNAAPFL